MTFRLQQTRLVAVRHEEEIMPSLLPLQLFKNLSDETRLSLGAVVARKRGALRLRACIYPERNTAKNIAALALLRESGLLIDRRDGKWIHYRLSPHMPAWAAAVIEQAYLCQRDEILHLSQQAERDNATTNGKAVCM